MLSAADSELPPGGHFAYLPLPALNLLEAGLLEFCFESYVLLMLAGSGDFNRLRPLTDPPIWFGTAEEPLAGTMTYSESGLGCIAPKVWYIAEF